MAFQFSNLADFFNMHGHGPYVWVSYLVVFIIMSSLAIAPRLWMRKLRRNLIRQRQTEYWRRHMHSSTQIKSAAVR
ncbi:MAG: heme exporter protein CcmD [Gammaproteobacteria bacterium]|nr:heme exporter protein CcmD [Gammaproteobacteria bacterium]